MKWKDRLKRASMKGAFTEKDNKLADTWCKCAVGERFKLPTLDWFYYLVNKYNRKKADRIHQLGEDFNDAVKIGYTKKAQNIYNKIQKLKK